VEAVRGQEPSPSTIAVLVLDIRMDAASPGLVDFMSAAAESAAALVTELAAVSARVAAASPRAPASTRAIVAASAAGSTAPAATTSLRTVVGKAMHSTSSSSGSASAATGGSDGSSRCRSSSLSDGCRVCHGRHAHEVPIEGPAAPREAWRMRMRGEWARRWVKGLRQKECCRNLYVRLDRQPAVATTGTVSLCNEVEGSAAREFYELSIRKQVARRQGFCQKFGPFYYCLFDGEL
jgi:hypothetical protein